MLSIIDCACVLELSGFGSELVFDVGVVAVLDVAVLNATHLMSVLLGEDLLVGDGLDGGMVVVLVDFAVYGGGDIFVAGGGDVLLLDGGVDGLWCC